MVPSFLYDRTKSALPSNPSWSTEQYTNPYKQSAVPPDKVLFFSTKKFLYIFFLFLIGLDKSGYQVVLFLEENICCGYSIEGPHPGASNEYPHVFVKK